MMKRANVRIRGNVQMAGFRTFGKPKASGKFYGNTAKKRKF